MDGVVSYKEFEDAQDMLKNYNLTGKWDDILKQCDLDGDGKIDFNEFYTAAVNHKQYITNENLEQIFNIFDKNKDGGIDINEFKMALPSESFGRVCGDHISKQNKECHDCDN